MRFGASLVTYNRKFIILLGLRQVAGVVQYLSWQSLYTYMKALFPILMLLFCSCSGQNTTTLTFVNKSPLEIDSIVLQKPGRVTLEKLLAGQRYSKTLEDVLINTNREGVFLFKVYLREKTLTGTWGFHDYGRLSSKNEVFYIFENGISSTEKPMKKPKEFRVYFYNASSKPVDSILNINNAIIKVNERSPRNFEIIYDYNNIEKAKEFTILIAGELKNSTIDHDFSNWNNNQAFYYFENDSLKKGSPPWREPLEFIVDLQVKLPFPSDSVSVVSDAMVKTYYFRQPNYLRIVFDFKKLRQSPVFMVITTNKKYKIDLSSHDFSNIYSRQKIFFLEEKGIRSLTE